MSGLTATRIRERRNFCEGLSAFTLDSTADFKAGQFFNLGVERDGKVVRRSYSAASAPGEHLEFFVSQVPGGELTPSLFSLEEGDTVMLDPTALGFFTLDEVPATKALWLVATGTGLGPYLSMLRAGLFSGRFSRVNLVHGVRHPSQAAYADELRHAEKQDPILRYLPVLSAPGAELPGALSGRITSCFSDGSLEAALGAFDQDSHMLLCGNPNMITEMVEHLKTRGFEKHRRRTPGHFNFEKYW